MPVCVFVPAVFRKRWAATAAPPRHPCGRLQARLWPTRPARSVLPALRWAVMARSRTKATVKATRMIRHWARASTATLALDRVRGTVRDLYSFSHVGNACVWVSVLQGCPQRHRSRHWALVCSSTHKAT